MSNEVVMVGYLLTKFLKGDRNDKEKDTDVAR